MIHFLSPELFLSEANAKVAYNKRNPKADERLDRLAIITQAIALQISLLESSTDKDANLTAIELYKNQQRYLGHIETQLILANLGTDETLELSTKACHKSIPELFDDETRYANIVRFVQNLGTVSTQPNSDHYLNSFLALNSELKQLHSTDNALKGIAGKTKLLLLDSSITLPNRHTALAWRAICGMAWNRRRKQVRFIIPHLPITTEHSSGETFIKQGTNANQSLAAKSKAHSRDEHGRILHGIMECHEATDSIIGTIIPYRDSSLMPKSFETFDNICMPYSCSNPSLIPHYQFDAHHSLSADWMYNGNMPADSGLRGLAKHLNVYFRFDSAYDAQQWSKAMANAMNRLLYMDMKATASQQFDTALYLTRQHLKRITMADKVSSLFKGNGLF